MGVTNTPNCCFGDAESAFLLRSGDFYWKVGIVISAMPTENIKLQGYFEAELTSIIINNKKIIIKLKNKATLPVTILNTRHNILDKIFNCYLGI